MTENSFEGQLILNNKGRESLNILICTSNGQIVSDCQIFPDNGFQIIPVPLKNVSSGIYLLKISDGQKIVTRKIVCG
ncbi:MAG: T9SS type A sorting domain-containing protein [Bacteroidetes bacterium]|nr:T9SS type A sorting domain-containing protein [Bacteroidota bacterium]